MNFENIIKKLVYKFNSKDLIVIKKQLFFLKTTFTVISKFDHILEFWHNRKYLNLKLIYQGKLSIRLSVFLTFILKKYYLDNFGKILPKFNRRIGVPVSNSNLLTFTVWNI